MIALPDVNVLIALAWPNHVHHGIARNWFRQQRDLGWATCPTTENGFIRVSSNHRITPESKTPRQAALLLRDLTGAKGHVFWTEESSIIDDRWIPLDKIHTYQQVTDAHLLSVALRNQGYLATFDQGIARLLPDEKQAERAIIVLSSLIE